MGEERGFRGIRGIRGVKGIHLATNLLCLGSRALGEDLGVLEGGDFFGREAGGL